jgi:hypothetical protein
MMVDTDPWISPETPHGLSSQVEPGAPRRDRDGAPLFGPGRPPHVDTARLLAVSSDQDELGPHGSLLRARWQEWLSYGEDRGTEGRRHPQIGPHDAKAWRTSDGGSTIAATPSAKTMIASRSSTTER